MRLTPKLALTFILYATVLLAVVGVLDYNSGRESLRSAVISELQATSIEKEAALKAWVEEKQRDIAKLAADPAIIQAATDLVVTLPGSLDLPAARNKLVAEIEPRLSSGEFLDVMLIDPQTGQVIAATDPIEEGKFKEDQLFFLNGKLGPYVQNLYYSIALQGPAMTAAAPLRTPDGRLLGVLAGDLDLDEMNTIVNRRSGLHQTDDTYLVNKSNLLVTQPRLLSDPGVLQRGVHSQAVDHCLQQNNGIAEASDYRDIPAIVIYRWLPEQGLCLIVKMDQAEAYAPARAFGSTVGAISALALLVAAMLAVALARSISRPVLALQTGALRFGRGELDVRLPEPSHDELGELAHEFNVMAAALEEKEAQVRAHASILEHQVGERTAELMRSDEALREREQTLSSIYNTAADVIFHLTVSPDRRYRFASVNEAFCSTTGLNYDQVVGKWVDEIIPEPSLAMVLGKYAESIREQKIVRWEETSDYPIGRLTGEVSVAPVFDADGNCTHLVGTVHDITERKQAEKALHDSEERYRLLFEKNPLPMWVYELDTLCFLSVNDAAIAHYGYERSEFLSMTIRDIRPTEELPRLEANLNEPRQMQERSGPWKHRKKDGSLIDVEVISHDTLFLGRPARLVLVNDITERKRAEERRDFLASASRALASTLDYATTLATVAQLAVPTIADWCTVYLAAPDGSIEQVALAHADPEKVKWARELQSRYPPNPNAPGGVAHVIRSGQAEFMPEIPAELLEPLKKDPEISKLLDELRLTGAMTVPLKLQEQTLGAISLVSAESRLHYTWDDLELAEELARRAVIAVENARLYHTAQRLNQELEQRVTQRTAQLEAANKELEAFAYSVSHDLRAPLRHIDGFIEMLQKRASGSLDDKSQHYLVTIAESAQQMGTLIDDLLTFSRMGRNEMFKTQVDLGKLAAEVIKELESEAEERDIQWRVADLPSVNGDRAMLRIVLVNLIANAIKFTRHNEHTQVEIGCIQDDPGEVTLFFRDNGVGFDMKYVDKLFNVFQRLHRVEEFDGTGIGLANVRRIINRHGGRTWAEGQIGQGATFYFSLPTSG